MSSATLHLASPLAPKAHKQLFHSRSTPLPSPAQGPMAPSPWTSRPQPANDPNQMDWSQCIVTYRQCRVGVLEPTDGAAGSRNALPGQQASAQTTSSAGSSSTSLKLVQLLALALAGLLLLCVTGSHRVLLWLCTYYWSSCRGLDCQTSSMGVSGKQQGGPARGGGGGRGAGAAGCSSM